LNRHGTSTSIRRLAQHRPEAIADWNCAASFLELSDNRLAPRHHSKEIAGWNHGDDIQLS
jgi:hypothetical protein